MKRSIAFAAVALVIAIFAVWSIYLPTRPSVLGVDAPANVFSAARAEVHVEAIAQRPHPVGSEEIRRVRRYLVEQIGALGLDVEMQRTPYLARLNFRNYGAQVENILVRIAGRKPGPAMLFVAHYDSVPQGPGAADDASGVAALLEMLRALAAGPALTNDLIVLLSDAEEPGILGAQAFHDLHPWMADVRMVINLEARGYRGPLIMFETGVGNARWVRELHAAGVPVIAASFTSEIYARMPNETDFTVFRKSQIAGLNFAFIHDAVRYHTALDSIENLDRRSLQQQGEIALALARHLGNTDLEAPAGGDAVYFNLPGTLLVFPMGAAKLLCFLVVLGALVVLVRAVRGGGLTAGRAVGAALALMVSMAAIAAALLGVTTLVAPDFNFARPSGVSSYQLVQLGQAFLAVGLSIAFYRLLRRRFVVAHLAGGGTILWLLMVIAAGLTFTGASYLFLLPLAAALPAAALAMQRPDIAASEADTTRSTVAPLIVAALALPAVVAALLWPVPLNLAGLAIGPLGAAVLTGLFLSFVILGLLAPLLALSDGNRPAWLIAFATLLLAVGAFSLTTGSHNENNRRLASLFYVLDQESDEAHWYSLLPFNHWTRQYLGDTPEALPLPNYLGLRVFANRAPAPSAAIEGPRVQLRSTMSDGGLQTWQVEVNWAPDVSWFHLFVEPRDHVRAVTLGDQRRDISRDLPPHFPTLTWFAPPEGLTLGIEVEGDAPLELELVGVRAGHPEIPGFAGEPMPADMMMARSSFLHISTSTRSVVTLTAEDVLTAGDAPSVEGVAPLAGEPAQEVPAAPAQ